jgi:hypothetical protein
VRLLAPVLSVTPAGTVIEVTPLAKTVLVPTVTVLVAAVTVGAGLKLLVAHVAVADALVAVIEVTCVACAFPARVTAIVPDLRLFADAEPFATAGNVTIMSLPVTVITALVAVKLLGVEPALPMVTAPLVVLM